MPHPVERSDRRLDSHPLAETSSDSKMKMQLKPFYITLVYLFAMNIAQSQPLGYRHALDQARAAEERYLYADALKWYQTAWELDDSDINVLVALSKQLTGLERLEEARGTFLQIIERDPSHAEAHTLLAIYDEKMADDFGAAKTHYQKAIEADPNYIRPRILLCQLLMQLQELEQAKSQAQMLIKQAPNLHNGYSVLGGIALKQNEMDDAVSLLQKAIAFTNDDPEPYRLLGQALARSGKQDEAQTALKQYQQIKEANETLSSLITNVRRSPHNAIHWFQLGKEYLSRRQTQQAMDALSKGLEHAPDSAAIHALLGALYLQAKQAAQAQSHLEAAVSLAPEEADHYNNLGVCYLMQGQYEPAVTAFQTALRFGTDEPGIRRNLNIALQKLAESQ